jgi:hypothetical protein
MLKNATEVVDAAKTAIILANSTVGVDQAVVDQAVDLVDMASDKLHLVEADGSGGFHNPEMSYAYVSDAV